MYARAIDDAASRLRDLRNEERGELGLAAITLGLAVVATQLDRMLAVSLFVGGLVVGSRGLGAVWHRWELIDRLAGDRDAYAIPEVLAYASRETTMERRQTFAAVIRRWLEEDRQTRRGRLRPAEEDLDALVRELEDETLSLDTAAAVACMRLLSDPVASPLLNPELSTVDLRSRVLQIRQGFTTAPARPS